MSRQSRFSIGVYWSWACVLSVAFECVKAVALSKMDHEDTLFKKKGKKGKRN